MEISLLRDIAIIFGLAVLVILAGNRLRIPPLVGFLLTGALAGPYGFRAVRASEQVEIFAEIGVVLLLFTIGLEFSLRSLVKMKKVVFIGGGIQVLVTIAAGFIISRIFGGGIGQSIFIGFLLSLSSTAIVLKLLQEKREADSPHGRAVLGILIFQDIIAIPMILFTPMLTGAAENLIWPILVLALKGAMIVILVIVAARWLVPSLLDMVARTRNHEVFILSVLLILFLCELASRGLGISFALGAFIAGLMIAESEYNVHALGNILPFRNAFIGLFFVSVGMLLNIEFFFDHLLIILLLTLGVLCVKTIIAGLVALAVGFPFRSSVLVGFGLSQVGEFAFVLSKTGLEHNLLRGEIYQWFLSVSILTMGLTPLMIYLAPRVAELLRPIIGRKIPANVTITEVLERAKLNDHLIVVGFGVNGRNLARTARAAQIPYVIVEMNPDTVKMEKENGEPIFYGDASQDPVLEHAGVEKARVMVIAISDSAATRRIAGAARHINSGLYIIARTRFVEEVGALHELGADEVIPEEFETSIEIFTRVLTKYLVPLDEIERLVNDVRADNYQMLRNPSQPSASFADVVTHLSEVQIAALQVADLSSVVEKSLQDLDMRRNYGITVVAIRRGKETFPISDPEFLFKPKDTVIMLGTQTDIAKAKSLFQPQT